MEVKMNKEIRNYQESMFMGLLWFFPVPWHECGAVCLGVYQV